MQGRLPGLLPSWNSFSWVCHTTRHEGSWFPNQGPNLHTLPWKRGFLAPGPPGKSHHLEILNNFQARGLASSVSLCSRLCKWHRQSWVHGGDDVWIYLFFRRPLPSRTHLDWAVCTAALPNLPFTISVGVSLASGLGRSHCLLDTCLCLVFFSLIWVEFIINHFLRKRALEVKVLRACVSATMDSTSHLIDRLARYRILC